MVQAQPLIVINVPQEYFEGKPEDVIKIPVTVRNVGNETAYNITVYISGPVKGFQYTMAAISKLEPNQNTTVELAIYLKDDANAGTYDLKIVGRVGALLFEKPIKVRVLTVIDYKLDIQVEDKYLYGSDVEANLVVKSLSNGVIVGTISYELYSEEGLLKEDSWVTYINPQEKWEYTIFLPKPKVGKYTIILRADFAGITKTLTKSFLVYRRNLTYEAYFENGIIYVKVMDKEGNGVKDIPVEIGGTLFKTDPYGFVKYEAKEPGVYKIKLNLDGKIVETFVEVKKLFIDWKQKNETLIVYVRDASGKGISNVSIEAVGPSGKAYAVTDENGQVEISLNETGFGLITIKADSSRYIGTEVSISVEKPKPKETPTVTVTTTTTSTHIQINETSTQVEQPRRSYGYLPIILILSAMIFGITSYAAFFMPITLEEQLDKYYFVKVKAPKLRSLRNFRYEKVINAVDARATKGEVTIENNKVVWEIEELEPEEEAFLQVLL
nr:MULTISPECIES: Ig-like domain-containing protein [unclassified Thermococcus]